MPVALGFGFGAVVSIVAFGFAVSKSLGLLAIRGSRAAAAFSFKWFVPRIALYGAALLVSSKLSYFDFASTVAGVFLCNAVLILYEPLICRFYSSSDKPIKAFSREI
ncbi:MAG: hypothetical protein JW941_10000 [Candidatus Coatesbacteria bacterium]|nr:hypothetical protein [Candidatus Coatesbacteria bacterium]